jgi:5'-nucleotidase
MRILVTNDDGIYSPGLMALATVAARLGDVRIVAPDVEQSSMGHAVTAGRPLKYRPLVRESFEAYRVDGTPADCVALGGFHWEEVDVVLSGINLGLNLGNGIWHSGTVSAARQASLLGIQGIAISAPGESEAPDYEVLAPHVEEALRHVIGDPALPLVNINLPLRPRGMRWTRQSVRHYDGWVVPGKDPRGRPHFWFTVQPIEGTEEDTDRWAIDNGWISITPLRLDITDETLLRAAASTHPLDGSGRPSSEPARGGRG